MKVLMPFIEYGKLSLDSVKTYGGLESFAKTIYKHIPDIVPVEITEHEQRCGRAKNIINMAIRFNQPEIILSNYKGNAHTVRLLKYELPVIWIWHHGEPGHIAHIEIMKHMKEFTDCGGHLYFVSKDQHDRFNVMSRRVVGQDIKVDGYLRPAFCGDYEYIVSERKYDALTIGRNDETKNPFWTHSKLANTGLTSAVITGNSDSEYAKKNTHWKLPQEVLVSLPHSDVMKTLASAGCLISTCPIESWGITTLEALSMGVPVILVTDNTGSHASESIAADTSHFRKVNKNISSEDLAAVVRELGEFSNEKRLEIATMTRQKHSKEEWVKHITDAFRRSAGHLMI